MAEMIRSFRKNHLSELQALAQISGSSLGYGSAKKAAEEVEDSSLDDEESRAGAGGDGAPVPATA